jgi:hypothetical protein
MKLKPPSTVVAAGRPSAMRNISAPKPVTPIARNVPRMTACSGFDLMRMRYGFCT